MSYRYEIHHDMACLSGLPDNWDALSRGNPFRQRAWLGTWWNHYGEGSEPFLVLAKNDAGEVRGLLPLYRVHQSAKGRLLRAFGDQCACTDYFSVLAREPESIEISAGIGTLLAQVAQDTRHGWEWCELQGVVEGDRPTLVLTQHLADAGASVHARSRMHTWFARCQGDWDQHLAAQSKRTRRRLKDYLKKIDEDPDLLATVQHDPSDVDWQDTLSELIRLHQVRWSDQGQYGSFASPEFCDYFHAAADTFMQRGQLLLASLRRRGKVVAANVYFAGTDDRLYCYSSGNDLESDDLQPGNLLTAWMTRYAHQRCLAGIDYMRGDEDYKQRLKADSRRLLHLEIASPTWTSRLLFTAWSLSFEAKQAVRRHSGRLPFEVLEIT
ncbi:MAG: GNAT family N-acetyltransferase [Planctomycetota bacterium]